MVRCECCGWELVEIENDMCEACEAALAAAVEEDRE